jgi:hypothetical protein
MAAWEFFAPQFTRAESLLNTASGLMVLLLGIQAYCTLRPTSSKHRQRAWAWNSFLAYTQLLGASLLLFGLKDLLDQFGIHTRGFPLAAACLQAASLLVLPLWISWLPPLSPGNIYQASFRRAQWSITYLTACAFVLPWLGFHPTLLSRFLVLSPLVFLVCIVVVCRKIARPSTNECTASLAWAFLPLAAYPGLQLPSLFLAAWTLKLQLLAPAHLHILLATLAAVIGLPCAWFWILFRSRLRQWHGYWQFYEWPWAVLVMAIVTMSLTGLPALTPILAALYRVVFTIGMAYALGGRPLNPPSRPSVRAWIWAFLLAALVMATAAFVVIHDASAFAWAPILGALVAVPCWLMLRVRQFMRWFGAGAGWWPPNHRTGRWLT